MGKFSAAYGERLKGSLWLQVPEVTAEQREAFGRLADAWADIGRPAVLGALYPLAALGALLLAWDDDVHGWSRPE